ncbi:hypothetical protein [Rhizobium sp. N122]|uniref:hypothetical protein n=1 Tax=Rhizobium sp. N122 TaxID=1764272 RepID=UPI001FDA3468|nr:hypothetical protein [Rhizobium sp. N122]
MDEALFLAIDEAVDQAVRAGGAELQSAGFHTSPHEYFSDAALRHLFMRLCRADVRTYRGGDPDVAWKILYAGRNVARRWEMDQVRLASTRKKKEHDEDIERDQSERRQLAISAQTFVLGTVVRALVEHVRAADPEIDGRLRAAVEARVVELDGGSDTDRAFIESTRNYLSYFTKVPEGD